MEKHVLSTTMLLLTTLLSVQAIIGAHEGDISQEKAHFSIRPRYKRKPLSRDRRNHELLKYQKQITDSNEYTEETNDQNIQLPAIYWKRESPGFGGGYSGHTYGPF